MLSASLGAAPPRGAQAHTASIAVVLDDDNDDNDDNAVGVGLALPGTARSVYRHASAVANERPHTSRRVTFAAPSTQPTPLHCPTPQLVSDTFSVCRCLGATQTLRLSNFVQAQGASHLITQGVRPQ